MRKLKRFRAFDFHRVGTNSYDLPAIKDGKQADQTNQGPDDRFDPVKLKQFGDMGPGGHMRVQVENMALE